MKNIEKNKKAIEFLHIAEDFKLGKLPTEQQHPLTKDLAELSRNNVAKALNILQEIDVAALKIILEQKIAIQKMAAKIDDVLENNGRIFLYGCGATGRLSLALGYIWRSLEKDDTEKSGKIIDFMSGGDYALIHSIENFEDYPEYGARQIKELGFGKDDLLISCTEGGETPSVIGATAEAAKISNHKPYFLYCNPDKALEDIDRSKEIIETPTIEKICLATGPMALSGSTRMQASTVLMLAVGISLVKENFEDIESFINDIENMDFSFLMPFIKKEADIYKANNYILYEIRGDDGYGMTILTDTTERAPTFSLRGFENWHDDEPIPSLSYLYMTDAQDKEKAIEKILHRKALTLEWSELEGAGSSKKLAGVDFSTKVVKRRKNLVSPHRQHHFKIWRDDDFLYFELAECKHRLDVSKLSLLQEHLLLKLIMNMHSTLLMGRINRYESNMMSWVKPSNNKLIDRAIRYIEALLKKEGIEKYSYEDICHAVFNETEKMALDESIVLIVFERLKNEA